MELKIIIVITIMTLIVYNIGTYKPVYSEIFGAGAPSLKSVVLFIITFCLFVFGLYLNEHPMEL